MPRFIVPYDRQARQAAFVRHWLTAGKASDYIMHATEEIRPGNRVVLWCRVSGHVQEKNHNLDDSELWLRKRAGEKGAIVVGVDRHTGPGWDAKSLCKVTTMARCLGAKIILAESTDRLIRNPLYSKDRQNLQARDADLREMQTCTKGIIIATDLHPDATPEQVRSYQRRRGQQMKNNCGGRPKTKIIDDQRCLLDAVINMMKSLPYKRGEGVAQRRHRLRPPKAHKNRPLNVAGRTA